MSKLRKPRLTGMKIYCTTCCRDNPGCRHFEKHVYRIRLHVKGSLKKTRVKTLINKDYDLAVSEALAFKRDMVRNNFQVHGIPKPAKQIVKKFTLLTAILKYDQYLAGKHELVHLKKVISSDHRKELIRCCTYFSDVVKSTDDIAKLPLSGITQQHVARFYSWCEQRFAPKTFNKTLAGIKSFFAFMITVEKVKIENPFGVYITKAPIKRQIETLSKEEFNRILNAVDVANPISYFGNGVKKNMYYPYLKDAFRLFLLTGGRREEVVELKWSDIMTTAQRVRFFQVANRKVEKQRRAKNSSVETAEKYFPINSDLQHLLDELGFDIYKGQNRYILCPDRQVGTKTIMNRISKSFTHYRKEAGIQKELSLDELRKTYLTWMNVVMNSDTKVLSSHTSNGVLETHYYDPKVLSAIEKAALEFKIFGT